MTDKTVSISDLEARLVYIIHRELGYQVGEIFTPSVTLKSNTDRHTFYNLVERNLFIQTGYTSPPCYIITKAALEAYDQWAQRCSSCISGEPHMHVTKVNHNPSDVPIARVVPNPDPLTDYRGALKEIMTIIEDHDANCAESKADEVLTEIYQLIEHIIDLHETTQE